MDLYGRLQLKWAVGYKGLKLHYVDSSTLVYSCGNTLSFVEDTGKHVCSIQSEGQGVGPLEVCAKAGLVAYAEVTLNPKIFLLSYSSYQTESTLEGGAQLEYTCLAFSDDGKRLASLSGVPDFKLTLWDCNECCVISQVSVSSGGCQLSFNPLNWKQLCLVGTTSVTLWNLEQCDAQNLLSPTEVQVPDKSTPVGTVLFPASSGPRLKSTLKRKDTLIDHGVSLVNPPNMSDILYQESYDEFMQKKQPVKLMSHCWTPKQSIYVGCAGGQLLLVEFDSGSVRVLINPQLTAQDVSSHQSLASKISEESDARSDVIEPPKTGHAMLGEDCIDVMALSRDSIFTAGKNGIVYRFELNEEFTLAESLVIKQPVTSLAWSLDYSSMVVGTEQGRILKVDPHKLNETISLVSDHLHSQIVGIDVLTPGYKHAITCREDGTVQLWDVQDGTLVSSYNLNTKCSCVCCPLSCHMAVVGSASGANYILSYCDPVNPRLVEEKFMHNMAVKIIRSDQYGNFMASASSEGSVFLYDCRPSSKFAVIGHLDIPGEVIDLSLLSDDEHSSKTSVSVVTAHEEKQLVTLFQLPHTILNEVPPELYTDATKQFSKEFVSWQQAELSENVSSFILIPGNNALALLESAFQLARFTLSSLGEKNLEPVIFPDSNYKAHKLGGGKFCLSFHQKWITSIASDGVMLLRLVERPEPTVACNPHHYLNDFPTNVVFTKDSQSILTSGDNGTITCWKMEFSDHGSVKGSSAAEYLHRNMRRMESKHTSENAILESMPSITQTAADLEDKNKKTWLQLAKEEAHRAEDEKYAENKAQLREEIGSLREKVLTMIATNEELPDIEKLERHEFILDTEEHHRLQAEEEQLIQGVRDEVELSNLAMMYTRECIKQDCWDGMKVKGVVLKAFQSRIEVSNYPLKSRSDAMLKELDRIKVLRKIELAEIKIRNEVGVSLKQTLSFKFDDPLLDDDDLTTKDKQQMEEAESKGDPDSLLGSHGAQFGGGSDLLLDQFELHSPVGKKHQIVLLEDCVYRMKETFNKEFDEATHQKETEIARIAEKNIRISKIINQLKLDDKLVQPKLDSYEQPQRLLNVNDSEVTVEKYVPPEEQKRLEEVAKQEELKRLAEMGDNPRERALDMMMGGRLEANVEEDLFKDLPRPDFISKDPSEMSEDEIRLMREFEKKEEAFLEEREKLKKALEAELRKLQSTITQGMEQFDERLQRLFELKIKTETAMHQEELKILHLTRSLLLEKQVTMKTKQLNQLLEEKKVEKVQLGSIISTAKRTVDEFRDQYEQMAAEDRELDKSFKRDFSDCEPFVDQLYKLFRKRPKGYRLKPGPSDTTSNLVSDPKSQNPFALRPSSAVKGERGQRGERGDVEDPMLELDDISYMPEGLEPAANWERFVLYRRRKIDSEKTVKAMALKLAEMNAFLQKRQTEDENLQQEIQDVFKELNKLQEDKMVFDLNLEIQFLLKQGQVEIDMAGFVPDFSESVLVHRRAIEELNSQIKTLGESKLHSMLECKDFKQGIHMLEWEHKKLKMEAEDLVEKAKDIQMLRVTKELQQRLMEENVASKDQHEIETLEKTIELNQKMHRKSVRERKKALGKIQQEVADRHTQNKDLENQVLEYQILVAERDIVENLAGIPPSEANREQRMQDIVTRRRLVETVKAQDQQIAVLRSELERLRMRTFPALVQVD